MFLTALNMVGALLLLHAAYSFRHYKQLVHSLNLLDAESFPFDVIIEIACGFLCILLAQTASLRLKPIRISADIKARSYEEQMGNSEFAVFNHRGKFVAERLRSCA